MNGKAPRRSMRTLIPGYVSEPGRRSEPSPLLKSVDRQRERGKGLNMRYENSEINDNGNL